MKGTGSALLSPDLNLKPRSENVPFVQASGITKSFWLGEREISVLKGLNLQVSRGEFIAIMGSSGSGKSTLLHILGCLDQPTAGTYRFAGRSVEGLTDKQRSQVRANEIGFVFQKYHLLPQLSVFENIEVPFLYSPNPYPDKEERILEALSKVGLTHRAQHRPAQLSGGEMQRVALARAMVLRPALLVADEPTGSLDEKTGSEILALIELAHQSGTTVILVTHDSRVAARAEKVLVLREGRVAS